MSAGGRQAEAAEVGNGTRRGNANAANQTGGHHASDLTGRYDSPDSRAAGPGRFPTGADSIQPADWRRRWWKRLGFARL